MVSSVTPATAREAPRIDSTIRVETPENIWLTFRPAGPAPRMWAFFIDLVIRLGVVLVLVVLALLISPLGRALRELPTGILLLGLFFVEWGYGFLFEAFWNGRTLGKKAAGLRVIKVGGYPIGVYDALLRNLLRVADGLPVLYGLGLCCMFATRRMQRIGDLVAGTIVVHERREVARRIPPWVQGVLPIPASQFTHEYRPSERTLDLIERFLSRAQSLPTARADEIARILAGPLKDRLGYWDLPHEHQRAPGWFLLRVLRTFAYPPRPGELAPPVAGPPPGSAP